MEVSFLYCSKRDNNFNPDFIHILQSKRDFTAKFFSRNLLSSNVRINFALNHKRQDNKHIKMHYHNIWLTINTVYRVFKHCLHSEFSNTVNTQFPNTVNTQFPNTVNTQFPNTVFTESFQTLFSLRVFKHCFHWEFSNTVCTKSVQTLFTLRVSKHCLHSEFPNTVYTQSVQTLFTLRVSKLRQLTFKNIYTTNWLARITAA